ncbi:MAG: hypothetical protein E7027_06050 [Elusimicrobium sp.]|uniref:G8 domain-containing protein n=1 Tax=Candidatus Avelusimicrobium gallicola TaxID=2562704 RepID=A0A928DS27_9BACT|nr:hypothetical protein [Elusimicrobium sp.]
MKKFILLGAALFACGALYAESMQFVTLLSSPLGTFSRLETADPAVATRSQFVNFGTTKVGTGQIDLVKKAPSIKFLHLASGTTLSSGNLAAYYTTGRFEIGPGGTVTGKSLLATSLSYKGSTSAKSEVSGTLTLANTGKFVGGYAGSMILGKAKTVASRPDNVGLDMHWSNIHKCEAYKTDGTCPTGKESTYAKSFVLKSKASFDAPCGEGPKGASYTDFCPTGQTGSITMTWDTGLCAYKETKNTCKNTKKRCLTKRRWCKLLDVGTGALNSGAYNEDTLTDCSDLKRGFGHLNGCAVAIGMYGGDDFNSTFKQVPMGCSWGQECDSCELNAYYASSSNGVYCATCKNMMQYAYGPGSVRTLYNVAYAVCTELDDCAEGEERTDCWDIGSGSNSDVPIDVPLTPVPMDPNL